MVAGAEKQQGGPEVVTLLGKVAVSFVYGVVSHGLTRLSMAKVYQKQ